MFPALPTEPVLQVPVPILLVDPLCFILIHVSFSTLTMFISIKTEPTFHPVIPMPLQSFKPHVAVLMCYDLPTTIVDEHAYNTSLTNPQTCVGNFLKV